MYENEFETMENKMGLRDQENCEQAISSTSAFKRIKIVQNAFKLH